MLSAIKLESLNCHVTEHRIRTTFDLISQFNHLDSLRLHSDKRSLFEIRYEGIIDSRDEKGGIGSVKFTATQFNSSIKKETKLD